MKKYLFLLICLLFVINMLSCSNENTNDGIESGSQGNTVQKDSDTEFNNVDESNSPPPYSMYNFDNYGELFYAILDHESRIYEEYYDEIGGGYRFNEDFMKVISKVESGEYKIWMPALNGTIISLSAKSTDKPIWLYSRFYYSLPTILVHCDYDYRLRIHFGFSYSEKLYNNDLIETYWDYLKNYYPSNANPNNYTDYYKSVKEKEVTFADGHKYKIMEFIESKEADVADDPEHSYDNVHCRFIFNKTIVDIHYIRRVDEPLPDDFWSRLSFVPYENK